MNTMELKMLASEVTVLFILTRSQERFAPPTYGPAVATSEKKSEVKMFLFYFLFILFFL
jgi:hypothetical protein